METNDFYYTKNKYVTSQICQKRLWLDKYLESEKEYVPVDESRIETSKQVKKLGLKLFNIAHEVKGKSLDEMVMNTKVCLSNIKGDIANATFVYENCYCTVDVLVYSYTSDTFSIYEIESTTSIDKKQKLGMKYAKYILEKNGLKISSCNFAYVNNRYVRSDELDVNEYFRIIEDNFYLYSNETVAHNINESNRCLDSHEEPSTQLSSACNLYEGCPFKNHCKKTKGIDDSKPSVLDLYNYRNRYYLIERGIIDFKDLIKEKIYLSTIQERQVLYSLRDIDEDYINKECVRNFIQRLEYPLYFLDFETFQEAIPTFNGTKPYQQVTFQYSLHVLNENQELTHYEFLGNPEQNPQYEIALQLVEKLGSKGTIIAYNKSFEQSRIEELAYTFPHLYLPLMKLISRFEDLADVFQKGYYYNKRMGGSFSIKSVLPALFPNNDDLDYHKLKDVHNGFEATKGYKQLLNLDENARIGLRKNLLSYCKLDTYSMVVIYKLLKEKTK